MKRFYLSCLFFLSLYADDYNFAPNLNTGVEKEIVVCIPSYNNELYCIKNLESIFAQEYENFQVIYIDDASTDRTGELVEKYIQENDLDDRFIYIRNETNQGAMANWIRMIYSLKDSAIVVNVDGDDFLAHSKVLQRVNAAYADPKVWVTYGSYLTYPGGKKGNPISLTRSQLKNREYRKWDFLWSHLRTYYAGLFKKIPRSWFLDADGEFLSIGADVPMMIGLMDLCHEHVFYIPETLYLYNQENVLNDIKKGFWRQKRLRRQIFRRKPLKKLKNLPF